MRVLNSPSSLYVARTCLIGKGRGGNFEKLSLKVGVAQTKASFWCFGRSFNPKTNHFV